MRPTRLAFVGCLLPVLALGCGSSQKPSSPPGDPGAAAAAEHAGEVAGAGAGAAQSDCADWRSWTKVNSSRFLSKGHGGKWVDVYVEPAHVESYRGAASANHPVGMRIIKAGYKDEAGTQFEALTVMGKMEPGYDPSHGDWYYGVLMEDGVTAKMQGKLESCINCHEQAAARDYVFGAEGK